MNRTFTDSPSLRALLDEALTGCYEDARREAADETELAIDTFPEICPYTIEAALNVMFLPD
jgi:hypothetical protein